VCSSDLLVELITEQFKSKREVPPLKLGDYMRVSSFAALCPREEVLRSLHSITKSDEVEPDLNLIFAHGSGLHYTLQNNVLPVLDVLYGQWTCLGCGFVYGADKTKPFVEAICKRPVKCEKCGSLEFLFKENFFTDEQYHLTGHPDGFLKLPQYEGMGVLEAKSISPRGAWEVKSCPKMDHVIQSQIYCWMTGFKWSQILYWDKGTNGTAGLIEHHVERDDETIEQVLETVKSIWSGIGSKSLPDRVCATNDCPRAEVCPVRDRCFSEVK
jgi:hypothetical protein